MAVSEGEVLRRIVEAKRARNMAEEDYEEKKMRLMASTLWREFHEAEGERKRARKAFERVLGDAVTEAQGVMELTVTLPVTTG